jgi:hypothetical protein
VQTTLTASPEEQQHRTDSLCQFVQDIGTTKLAAEVINTIKKFLKNRAILPEQKLGALKVLNAVLACENPLVVNYASTKLYNRLLIYGRHRKNLFDPNRGADLFGERYANN